MKKIASINYEDINFKFIANHHDIHLGGTCIYKGRLCEFISKYTEYDEDKDEWEDIIIDIYSLNFKEWFKW